MSAVRSSQWLSLPTAKRGPPPPAPRPRGRAGARYPGGRGPPPPRPPGRGAGGGHLARGPTPRPPPRRHVVLEEAAAPRGRPYPVGHPAPGAGREGGVPDHLARPRQYVAPDGRDVEVHI